MPRPRCVQGKRRYAFVLSFVGILVSLGAGCSRRATSPANPPVAVQQPEEPTAVATDPTMAPPAAALTAETRERARAALIERRKTQIARLDAYAKAGVFPVNRKETSPLHMFRDPAGNLCAIANLVYRDGLVDLVDRTATERNDVTVADEETGALHDWVLTSGLTREEVGRIQYPALYDALGELERHRAATTKRLLAVEAELVANSDASITTAIARLEEATPGEALANFDVTIRKAQDLSANGPKRSAFAMQRPLHGILW